MCICKPTQHFTVQPKTYTSKYFQVLETSSVQQNLLSRTVDIKKTKLYSFPSLILLKFTPGPPMFLNTT